MSRPAQLDRAVRDPAAVHQRPVEVGAVVQHHVVGHRARHRLPDQQRGGARGIGIGDLGLVRRGQQRGDGGQPRLRAGLARGVHLQRLRSGRAGSCRRSWSRPRPCPRTRARRCRPTPRRGCRRRSSRAWSCARSAWRSRSLPPAARSRGGVWKFTSPERCARPTLRRFGRGVLRVSSMVIRLSGRTCTTVPSKNVISAAEPGPGAHEVALSQHHARSAVTHSNVPTAFTLTLPSSS